MSIVEKPSGGGGRGRGGRGRGRGGVTPPPRQPQIPGEPQMPKRSICREVMNEALKKRKFWCYDDKKILVSSE